MIDENNVVHLEVRVWQYLIECQVCFFKAIVDSLSRLLLLISQLDRIFFEELVIFNLIEVYLFKFIVALYQCNLLIILDYLFTTITLEDLTHFLLSLPNDYVTPTDLLAVIEVSVKLFSVVDGEDEDGIGITTGELVPHQSYLLRDILIGDNKCFDTDLPVFEIINVCVVHPIFYFKLFQLLLNLAVRTFYVHVRCIHFIMIRISADILQEEVSVFRLILLECLLMLIYIISDDALKVFVLNPLLCGIARL